MNPFTQTPNRVAKLLEQYNTHNSIVIGVDFDFTIYDPITHTVHTDIINLLLQAEQLNCKLCLWTANLSRIPYILDVCKQHGLDFKYINESPIHIDTNGFNNIQKHIVQNPYSQKFKKYIVLKTL